MKLIHLDYHHIEEFKEEISLCLGYFDGVHIGHQYLIQGALKDNPNKVAVMSFNHPLSIYLNNAKSKEVLTSVDDRFNLLKKMGVSYLFVLDIDKDFIHLSADEFIQNILNKLNIKNIYVGKDYRFGRLKKGDSDLLKKYYPVIVKDLYDFNHEKIATSSIIKSLKEGDVKKANALLGRNYQIKGKVVRGFGLGNHLGYPTANINLDVNYVLPRFGVYKTLIHLGDKKYLSITNVGLHPTINELDKPSIEVFIPNLSEDLYDDNVILEFLEFVREEKRFDSIDDLKKEIEYDVSLLNK